jgi:pilus assembly protein CpaB
MRSRTLILLLVAVLLAGGTALLARSWLAAERNSAIAEATPVALPTPAKSVLVARNEIKRGQILKPEDMVWQVWPEGGIDKNYVVMGGPRTPESFAGWVAKNPVGAGEPVTDAKVIAPGDRGFLAAVLRPGMRAISVPVTVTSGISGFIFPGDKVDLLLTYQVPSPPTTGDDQKKNQYEHKAAATVLRDIRVIGIDQRLESKAGEAVVAHTATFEVTPKQSEGIALASEIGKVALTLRSLVPAEGEAAAGDKVADATAGSSPDSPIVESATYTLDNEISPLLPKRASGKADSSASVNSGVVTILRGSGKKEDAKASEPASKGS